MRCITIATRPVASPVICHARELPRQALYLPGPDVSPPTHAVYEDQRRIIACDLVVKSNVIGFDLGHCSSFAGFQVTAG